MHRHASAAGTTASSDNESVSTATPASASATTPATTATQAPPPRTFSTRFLPSDGIPKYNALLDAHLGKRREYLLGNPNALALLQQTGVIARVQAAGDNPNQYVVYMNSERRKPIHRRKRLPPPSVSSSSVSSLSDRRYEASELRKSATAPHLTHLRQSPSADVGNDNDGGDGDHDEEDNDEREDEREQRDMPTPMALRQRRTTAASRPPSRHVDVTVTATGAGAAAGAGTGAAEESDATPMNTASNRNNSNPSVTNKLSMMTRLGRSKSAIALPQHHDSVHSLARSSKRRLPSVQSPAMPTKDTDSDSGCGANASADTSVCSRSRESALQRVPPSIHHHQQQQQQQQPPVKKAPLKNTVEHLLESDASYLLQIRVMRDQVADLDAERLRLNTEVAALRKRLRGVNAVHENDVAVAHCSSIMQRRLSKAEEEYMKLLTAQLEVRKDVDRVRREIMSLRKVQKKLAADIDDVQSLNAAVADRIRASKATRNVVSAELVELEKKAELAIEEQRLALPPEEAVVVDVEKLMRAVQERNANRRRQSTHRTSVTGRTQQQLSVSTHTSALSYRPASATSTSSAPRLRYQAAFHVIQNALGCTDVTSFVDSFVTIEEQLLSKYTATLALEDESVALQKELETLMRDAAARTATIRGSHQATLTLHDELQRKVQTLVARIASYNALREVRIAEHARVRNIMQRCLEVLQAEKLLSSQASIGGPMLMSELPSPALLEALQKKMTEVAMVMKMKHSATMIEGPKNCFQAGRDAGARRSNMFSTREVSKIVLGPREPAGSALAAILGTAQAPSVESAMALTEMNSLESCHIAICAADMAAASSVTSRRVLSKDLSHGRVHPGGSASGGASGVDDVDTGVGPSSHPTIENTRRRSSRVSSSPVVFPVRTQRHSDDDDDDADTRDGIDESDDDDDNSDDSSDASDHQR